MSQLMLNKLSTKEQLRYSRHLMLKEVGIKGQLQLKKAHVVVIGAGGLGSPALLYLASAGIGTLTLLDDDKVELSNLQRQILYKINHLAQSKANAANKVLTSLNNQITINSINQPLTDDNAEKVIAGTNLVLDCSDNFKTRYIINKHCLRARVPLIAAAAMTVNGQLMCFDFRDVMSPCYHCLFPEQVAQVTENCSNAGVLSPLLGVIGSMQALLAVNLLLNHHKGSLVTCFDGLTLKQQNFNLVKDPSCPICS